jgi:hypothetical protein
VKHCQGFLFSSVFYISSLVSYLLYLFSLYAPKLNWPVWCWTIDVKIGYFLLLLTRLVIVSLRRI